MNKIRNRISPICLIFIINILGFLTGTFTIVLWQENWLITDGVLNQDFIYKIEELIIDKRALFFLCLEKRLCAFFLLFLLAFSSVNVLVNILFFFLNSLYIGSIIELLVIRYGLQGILMYIAFVFPQGIFYIMGYLILGCWCLKMEKNSSGEQRKKRSKVQQFAEEGRVATAFVFVLIGIILESYINFKLFKMFF